MRCASVLLTPVVTVLAATVAAVVAAQVTAAPAAEQVGQGLSPGAVAQPRQATLLVRGGRLPVILAPLSPPAQQAATRLAAALTARLGAAPPVVTTMADATPGRQTVIALGNMLDNELLTRLYVGGYTYEDARFPGDTGYTVHAAYDPYPWGGDQDVIVLGASQPQALDRAVDRFLGLLQGTDAATVTLPYVVVVEPAKPLTDSARQAILAKPVEPSFTAFRTNAEQYLRTGEDAYARLAVAALDTMVEAYRRTPGRPTPWPEETTAGPIFAAWDAFEECPLVPPERRADYVGTFLAWARDLTKRSYQYRLIDESFTVTWNHTTFALLGLYHAGRYFDRYHHLPEAAEWLRRARLGFAAQARSWKPMEDADSYLVLTMGHVIDYSLAEWDLRFLESGLIRRYADYVVACGDNRQLPAGFGDSGYGAAPTMAAAALPIAYWWTRDGGYRWLLEQALPKAWENRFWQDVEPTPPTRLTGLCVFPLDRQIYDDTQQRPTYGEAFAKADVPFEQAWDKISFRENWTPDGQYLLLDGLGRGKHLHFDTQSIVTFVQGGERWLIDHDYLVRNTTEHSMLTVLRDGRSAALVPSLAGLAAAGDLPTAAATHTYVRGDNGVDWERRILWRKGAWFLVRDDVTARGPGRYDLDLTWKTVDRGRQAVDGAGRFTAARPTAADNSGLVTVDDPAAAGGKAVVLAEAASRLLFSVDLPAGEYAVDAVAYGVDGGSDSLFLAVDDGKPVDVHVAQGSYGPSSTSFDHSTAAPRVQIAAAGPHVVRVTLRERPPVRIDRLEFRRPGAGPVVVHAATARPPAAGAVARQAPCELRILPAVPVQAWVTNHVRQGISVPVSILHQRQSRELAAGHSVAFASLVHAADAGHPAIYDVLALRDRVCRVTATAGDAAVAGFGADRAGRWACEATAWLVHGTAVELVGVRQLRLGDGSLHLEPAADASLDAATATLVVYAGRDTRLTPDRVTLALPGQASPAAAGALALAAGVHTFRVDGLDPAALTDAAAAPPPAQTAGVRPPPPPATAEPLWRVRLADGLPVTRIAVAEIDTDGRPELLVACGQAGHAVDVDGRRRWSFATNGVVRDVAPARLAKGEPPTLLVSSADTYLYLLDPAGQLRRKQQMTGIYFSADHGERPWGLYCTRAVDRDGDGVDDLLVTTLASMEALGFDLEFRKQWRTLAAYHGCMDIAVGPLDPTSGPQIVTADKYGAVHVLRPDGTTRLRSNTSIGDVVFTLADLDGDGRQEIVHGSSTGDLVAVDLTGKLLWRSDNYGYPVERLRAADLDGDGRPEILLASGTGYVYCLDAVGQVRWQRRLGLAVHDIAVADGLVAAGTEDGDLHVLDAVGRAVSVRRLGAAVTRLQPTTTAHGPAVVAGLADGHLVAMPLR